MTAEIIVKSPPEKSPPILPVGGLAEFMGCRAALSLDGLPHGADSTSRTKRWTAIRKATCNISRCAADKSGAVRILNDLALETSRFANVLAGLGVQASERVHTRRAHSGYIAVLGALKQRCVVSPLFSAFGGTDPRGSRRFRSVLVTAASL